MLVAQSDQPSLDPDEGERLSFILCEIHAEVCSHCRNHRQRLGVRLRPERPQLTQKDVGGDRADPEKREQTQFEIVRVARRLVHLPDTAVILVDKRLADSQYLV